MIDLGRRSPLRRAALVTLPMSAALLLAAPNASAAAPDHASKPQGAESITICHATHSAANPYVTLTVDPSSTVFTNGHLGHDDDVIPAYGDFPGRNLGTGEALLANDCQAAAVTVNNPPTVLVAALDSSVDEGTAIASSGSFSDPDGDPLTLSADNSTGTFVDNGDGTWSFSLPTDDDVAAATVTVTATDPGGLTVSDDFGYVAVNVAPSVRLVTASGPYGCTVDVTTGWSDPGTADTHTGSVTVGSGSTGIAANPTTTAWSFANAGSYPISGSVSDDDGGTGGAALAGGHTVYNIPGPILQPINFTGPRSAFKLGSTIPVKIRVANCAGAAVTDLSPTVSVAQAGVAGSTASTAAPKISTTMRSGGEQYIYNLATRPLTAGDWVITIDDPSFAAPVTATVTLKA